jgi:aspartate aminotransferase
MKPLAHRLQGIEPSATLVLAAKAKALKRQGLKVVDFTVGEPDFDTPDEPKAAAMEAIREGFTKYTPTAGIEELRRAVAERLAADHGLRYETSQVLISCGAKHSLYNISQALFEEGDEVIVPAPYWVTYPEQIRLAGAAPIVVPTTAEQGFRMTAEAFSKHVSPKTKAVILNSPSNPTGAAYSRDELMRLAEVAVRRSLTIISDEIYAPFVYDGLKHVSIASLSPEVQAVTLLVSGVSKSHAMTGWRIGYTAGPKEIIAAMEVIQSQSTSNPASISQRAAVAALKESDAFTHRMVAEFDTRRRFIVNRLNRIPGIRCPMPQGAFYVFPDVSAYFGRSFEGKRVGDSQSLSEYLLEAAHAAVVPGAPFGAPNHLRLSYATSLSEIQIGLDRIEQALNRLK